MNKEIKKTRVPRLRFAEFRDKGEWEEKALGNMGKFTGGGTPSKENDSYWKGNIPWISSSDIHDESIHRINVSRFISDEALKDSATKMVPENSILLVARVGVGKLAISHQSLCTSQDFINFTPINDNLTFLAYYLKSNSNIFLQFSQGMAIKGFTKEDILKLNLFLPTKPEQQKIAATLTTLDDLITAQSKKLKALQAHKKGLMQQLFPVDGETVPRLRFGEFEGSGEWEINTLLNVAKFRRGSFPQPYGLPEWYDEVKGMPFIQVFDVDDNLLLKPKTKNRISQIASKQSVFIPKGTVIITIQGSIGRVAITQYDAYIDRTLLIFEKFYQPLYKMFFAYVLQILFAIEKEKAPGGIIKTITKEVLSDFKILMPNIIEQQKIADCLSSLDDLITTQTQKLEALKMQKKGLMQQLFPNPNEMET